jgi:hypothetical protein
VVPMAGVMVGLTDATVGAQEEASHQQHQGGSSGTDGIARLTIGPLQDAFSPKSWAALTCKASSAATSMLPPGFQPPQAFNVPGRFPAGGGSVLHSPQGPNLRSGHGSSLWW